MGKCRQNTPRRALSRLDSMGRLSASLLVFALVAAATLGLSACGESGADLLPGDTASEITSNLDQVRELASEGECIGAEDAAREVSDQVDSLGGVDEQLKQALREGAERLTLVVEACEEAPEEEEEPAIAPAVEPEEEEAKEKADKPEKEKPQKEAKETQEEETETSPLPPQAEGKAKGHEKTPAEEVPPPEESGGTPSGGVGPGAAVEGE